MTALGSSSTQVLPWPEWSNLRSNLIWIYDGPIDSNHLALNAFMPGQSAFLIREGNVLISNEKGTISAEAGQWVFLKEELRTQQFSNGSHILSLRFSWNWPSREPLFNWDVAVAIDAKDAPELEANAKILEQIVEREFPYTKFELRNAAVDVDKFLETQCQFMLWLRYYAKAISAKGYILSRFEISDARIIRAIQMIDCHPFGEPFREAELAKRVNLSASHLGKLFIDQFGISPCRYFEKRKFEEALARVSTSLHPLKSIAIDLGFSSLPHFSSWFRRKALISPSVLRQSTSLQLRTNAL